MAFTATGFRPDLLPKLIKAPVPKAVLPTEEDSTNREGAKAAQRGVNKVSYYPPGATRPTALQKARDGGRAD